MIQLLTEWPKQRSAMRLAILMAHHWRVGVNSSLLVFDDSVLRHIAEYVIP